MTTDTLSDRVWRYLHDTVRIDTRSLAVFRVFVGLLIVADILLRSRNFSFYYTDDGAMPQSLAMEMTPEGAFSVFFFVSDPTLIALLFVVYGLVGIQLIVGYKTRIATILAFLLVISLDFHNPAVTSYADILFRLLLFWAIFLPLGERWSIDAVHRDRSPRDSVTGVASALILGQMVYMYLYNGYHKVENELWLSGEATPLIMGLDDMTFLLAPYLREFPTLLQLGGLTWFVMLLLSWLLIVLVGRPRAMFAGTFVIAHASFAVTVRIGAFAFVAIAGLVLFFQTQFWDDLVTLARSVNLEPARLASKTATLERYVGRLPRLEINHERYRRAKSGLYSIVLIAIVVSLVAMVVIPHTPLAAVDTVEETSDGVDDTFSAFAVSQPDWTVFAPAPRTTDRYYVFAAMTDDRETIDIYNNRSLSYDRPEEELQQQYDTYRERFYMNTVRRHASDNRAGGAHVHLLEYYETTWPDEHDTELSTVNIYAVNEDITMETVTTPDERETEIDLLHKDSFDDSEAFEIDPPE